MDWVQSAVLGVVEGLTEFLPVSSTGHLILGQRAMGLAEGAVNDAYAVVIQAGAIVAVLGLYAGRVSSMVRGLAGRDPAGRRLALCLVVAFLPAIPGGLLASTFKAHLFRLDVVAAAWAAGGIALLVLDRRRRGVAPDAGNGLESLTWKGALVVGLFQVLAVAWPGLSRSLVTMVGGLAAGMSLLAAVEFSFLLGLVTLLAATAKSLHEMGATLVADVGLGVLAVGLAASALSAFASVRWMVSFITRRGLAPFGWYRLALAAVVAGLLATGVLAP